MRQLLNVWCMVHVELRFQKPHAWKKANAQKKSMQVPIQNGDGCKRISYLLTQKYGAHTFGSWRWIRQLLGGTAQCLFVD